MRFYNKLKRQRYVTKNKHGKYKAGTECWIEREGDRKLLKLTFDDGVVLVLYGFYAFGLEQPYY